MSMKIKNYSLVCLKASYALSVLIFPFCICRRISAPSTTQIFSVGLFWRSCARLNPDSTVIFKVLISSVVGANHSAHSSSCFCFSFMFFAILRLISHIILLASMASEIIFCTKSLSLQTSATSSLSTLLTVVSGTHISLAISLPCFHWQILISAIFAFVWISVFLPLAIF